jgi:hypothetical protein
MNMSQRSTFFAAALCLTLLSPAPLLAKSSNSHWYQPHYMANIEDASNRLQFLSPHFAPGNQWGGPISSSSTFSMTNISESTLGLNIFFTENGVEEKSDGLFSFTSTSTPYTKEIVASIVYADIDYFMIRGNTNDASKTPWCVVPVGGNNSADKIICVPSESDAHQVVDALATLAVAYGRDLGANPGMWVYIPSAMELQKYPERTCEILEVYLDGPPAQAGIRAGDILQSINGKPGTYAAYLNAFKEASSGKPGSGDIHVEILRKKSQSLALDLHYPNQDAAMAQLRQHSAGSARHPVGSVISVPTADQPAPPANVHFGFQVRPVIQDDMAPLALTKAQGLVVVSVENGSLADTMGILAGDVILQLNGADVGDIDHFVQSIQSGAVKNFRVWRKGQTMELIVPRSL